MSSRILAISMHNHLHLFRDKPAALAVWMSYVSRHNADGVAWPSIKTLHQETGWAKNTVADARDWLVEHKALERDTNYVRPEWRNLTPNELSHRRNLDRAEYSRPTGYIEFDGRRARLLYMNTNSKIAGDDNAESTDVLPERMSVGNGCRLGTDVGSGRTEEYIKESLKAGSKKQGVCPSAGAEEQTMGGDGQQSRNAPLETKFGMAIGQQVYWTYESEENHIAQSMPAVVTKFTSKRVWVMATNPDGTVTKRCFSPGSLKATPHQFKTLADLPPVKAIIGRCSLRLKPDQGIGKNTATLINTIASEINTRFCNGKSVTPDELEQAYEWHTSQRGEKKALAVPVNPVAVVNMITEYRNRPTPAACPTIAPLTQEERDAEAHKLMFGGAR